MAHTWPIHVWFKFVIRDKSDDKKLFPPPFPSWKLVALKLPQNPDPSEMSHIHPYRFGNEPGPLRGSNARHGIVSTPRSDLQSTGGKCCFRCRASSPWGWGYCSDPDLLYFFNFTRTLEASQFMEMVMIVFQSHHRAIVYSLFRDCDNDEWVFFCSWRFTSCITLSHGRCPFPSACWFLVFFELPIQGFSAIFNNQWVNGAKLTDRSCLGKPMSSRWGCCGCGCYWIVAV